MLEWPSCLARDKSTGNCEPDRRSLPLHRTEATGDLLLYLGHAQIVFTLVVGEGGVLQLHETQDIVLKVSQSLQQVPGF